MNKKVQLSVIVPVYNAGGVLAECLNSICDFSGDIEIILVDDGSTDDSFAICEKYAIKDNRITVYRKQNGGVSSARNYGIKKASGEYTMFVDADDILMKGWGEIIVQIQDADIYYFSNLISANASRDSLLRYIVGLNEEGVYLSGPYSKLFKTNFLRKCDLLFNNSIINGEDMLFNINALVHAKTYKIINQQFYLYRQMIGQATRRFDARIIDSDRRFQKELHEILSVSIYKSELTRRIEKFCLANAVILISNRLSYAKRYAMVKKNYAELSEAPYSLAIDGVLNGVSDLRVNKALFKLCKKKRYRILFLLLKVKNKIVAIIKRMRNEKFVRI